MCADVCVGCGAVWCGVEEDSGNQDHCAIFYKRTQGESDTKSSLMHKEGCVQIVVSC